jgi:hypothetical protein
LQRRLSLALGGPRLFAALALQHVKNLAGLWLQHAGDRPHRFAAPGATLTDRFERLFHVVHERLVVAAGKLIVGKKR